MLQQYIEQAATHSAMGGGIMQMCSVLFLTASRQFN